MAGIDEAKQARATAIAGRDYRISHKSQTVSAITMALSGLSPDTAGPRVSVQRDRLLRALSVAKGWKIDDPNEWTVPRAVMPTLARYAPKSR